MDEVVALLSPVQARGGVADVMAHPGRAGREDGDVGAAIALQLELGLLQRLADLVVADGERPSGGHVRGVAQAGDLSLAIGLQVFWRRRVVPVTIDDHDGLDASRGG